MLFAASVAVPAGLFGFLAWESRDEALAFAFQQVEQTAGILHENAQKVLEINAGTLERAAQYIAMTGDSRQLDAPARLRDVLTEVEHSSPSVQSLWVFTGAGEVVATSLPGVPPGSVTVADREYFQHHRAVAGTRYFVSAPLVGRGDGRTQFILSRRLEESGGAFAGVAMAGIQAEYFVRQWQALLPELQPSAALVRDDGVVLVRHPVLPAATGAAPAGLEFIEADGRAPGGPPRLASVIDGTQRIMAVRRLAGYPVSISYAVSLDAVLAGWHRTLAVYGLVCGSAALALLGMTALVHHRYRIERRLVAQLRHTNAARILRERIARLLIDRQRAAVLIRRSEQRLRGIVESAQDAIIVTDHDGRIGVFNGAAQRMFGHRADAVIGEDIRTLVSSDCWSECVQHCHAPSPAGGGSSGTCGTGQARRADGTPFSVECAMSRLDEDKPLYTLILRDITGALRDRQALVDAHEELQRVTQGFQRELIAAVEARQARIARDLHDSVGASLAGISLLIGAARGLVGKGRPAAALDKAQEQVAATAEAVRGISRGLMPAGTDSGGLLDALEQFAADLGENSGIECTVRARGALTGLDAATATHVFRIVQESAANAIRHGHASVVRIVLCEWRGGWRVSVLDNGSGCDFGRLTPAHAGLGLRSMQARARAIGGELHLGASPQGGARVRVSWRAAGAARA